MDNQSHILGCFVSSGSVHSWDSQEIKALASERGALFNLYIWGESGISTSLKGLNSFNYGKDLILILLQFYVNPIPYLLDNLKEIEGYRKNEKSIGVSIVVTEDNFFLKSELERYTFLKESILEKLNMLAEIVKRKKLDTNIPLLKNDVEYTLINFINSII